MKFELAFDRVYPHPVDAVWRALTDKQALGQWLMETDFEPVLGREFKMWCSDGEGGTDTYLCVLRDYDPPRRMLWSWVLEGGQDDGEMLVEFRVEPVAGGARATVRHSGDLDPAMIERFKGGWPAKLEDMEAAILGTNQGG